VGPVLLVRVSAVLQLVKSPIFELDIWVVGIAVPENGSISF
jgi:hypothetical protein